MREGGDVARALRLYEDRRRGRTADVARRSRLLGTVVQLENPLLCAARNAAARAMPVSVQLRQLEAVLAHGT